MGNFETWRIEPKNELPVTLSDNDLDSDSDPPPPLETQTPLGNWVIEEKRICESESYTPYQTLILEKEFKINPYLTGRRREDISLALCMTENQVKIWFQNKRIKLKRRETPNNSKPEGSLVSWLSGSRSGSGELNSWEVREQQMILEIESQRTLNKGLSQTISDQSKIISNLGAQLHVPKAHMPAQQMQQRPPHPFGGTFRQSSPMGGQRQPFPCPGGGLQNPSPARIPLQKATSSAGQTVKHELPSEEKRICESESYTPHQTLHFEKEFNINPYLTIRRRIDIAHALCLTENQVKIWFHNKRMKLRGKENDSKPEDNSSDSLSDSDDTDSTSETREDKTIFDKERQSILLATNKKLSQTISEQSLTISHLRNELDGLKSLLQQKQVPPSQNYMPPPWQFFGPLRQRLPTAGTPQPFLGTRLRFPQPPPGSSTSGAPVGMNPPISNGTDSSLSQDLGNSNVARKFATLEEEITLMKSTFTRGLTGLENNFTKMAIDKIDTHSRILNLEKIVDGLNISKSKSSEVVKNDMPSGSNFVVTEGKLDDAKDGLSPGQVARVLTELLVHLGLLEKFKREIQSLDLGELGPNLEKMASRVSAVELTLEKIQKQVQILHWENCLEGIVGPGS